MEDAMAKALEVNDNTAQNQERQRQQQSGDKAHQPAPACFQPAPNETWNDPGVWVLPSQSLTTIGARND
jgi:hypothetical protein